MRKKYKLKLLLSVFKLFVIHLLCECRAHS